MFKKRALTFCLIAALGLLLFSSVALAEEKYDSTFDRIKKTGVLRVAGLVGEEPYFHKDLATGEWSGFAIVMARDLAEQLGAKLEVVESTWGNSVLDIQANKIDISFGLNPTEARMKVIDFTPPLFHNSFVVITRKGFKPETWADLNNPKVRIAVDIGSTHESTARSNAPNATITGYKTRDEAILAVQGGKADCFVATIILGLTSLKKNPALGNFVIPKPVVSKGVSAGIRIENDKRFRDFAGEWATKRKADGKITEWIVQSLSFVGIEKSDVPPEVQF